MVKNPLTEMLCRALSGGCQIFTPKSAIEGAPGGAPRWSASRAKLSVKTLTTVGLKVWVSEANMFCTRFLA